MIKVESIKDKRLKSDTVRIRCNVETSMPDNLLSVAEDVFIAELLAIFKQLYKINPYIITDAMEAFKEELKND